MDNYHEYLNGTDPNDITFSISVANQYVTTTTVPVQLDIADGVPYYFAVLVNNNNTGNANWQPYTGTSLNVPLGFQDGVYRVWIGLKGLPPDAHQTWEEIQFTLDRAPPSLTITSPVLAGGAATVAKPYLQLTGYANEQLASVTYDLANAAGTSTGLAGFVTDQIFDSNSFDYTTTYFQCFDIPLTTGPNSIALHATDLAGNATTANLTVSLDYSTSPGPPVLSVVWPPSSIPLSGSTFYVRGQVSDETASVTAQVVDANSNTTVADGVVERNGAFWVENLPLAPGASTVTLTVTDAAGHVITDTLIVSRSGVTLTIDSTPSDVDLYGATGSVRGTISDASCGVVVNGMAASVDGSGSWHADNVPIRGQGTATFDVVASDSSSLAASAAVEMPAYLAVVNYHDSKSTSVAYSGPPASSTTNTRDKQYDATYQADPSRTWTSAFHGVATDNNSASPSGNWSKDVYDWSNTGKTTHHTDSYGDDTTSAQIIETSGSVTGLPDEDVLETAPGGPAAKYVYHYYAGGVHYKWTQPDRGMADVAVSARMRQKLFTGGKATLNRQSLFHINAWALEYGKPTSASWLGASTKMVQPSKIQMLGRSLAGQQPDGTGDLYLVLPDNAAPNLDLRIPGITHYQAEVKSLQKHRLRIAANGWPLANDRVVPNAKFCVGQKINLTSYMTPSIDDQVQSLGVEWSPPNVFVNYIESWPNGAKKYLINWDLIFQQNISAWWVSGGEKHPRCDWTMTFKNGQTAKVATNGRIAMHRPAFSQLIPHPPFFPAMNTIKGFLALTVGDMNGNGNMTYEYSILSEFPGVANTTQLINREVHRDLYPFNITTDGYDLDTEEWYDKNDAVVYPNIEAWLPMFMDGPGFVTGRTYITIQDSFQDYVRFKPDGADSIWITIARVDWSWVGMANSGNGWVPPSGSVASPVKFDDSNFPFWLDVIKGVGGE